ncbi:NHL repeat-containing protein [Prosthecobacter sp.]|uniref:NHL repeat-containing protein n=1 Tax=Prosthecobacter sp. TaxID=1965333 RepID=UPI003783E295
MKTCLRLPVILIAAFLCAGSIQAQQYQWSNFVGSPGVNGSTDGSGTAARFKSPGGAALDSSGTMYVADTGNDTIRMVTSDGTVTTLAGMVTFTGGADGTGSAARFKSPVGMAVDQNGVIYVADTGNHTIRKITSAGVVTTLAGQAGITGSIDNTGSLARFNSPSGVAVDSSGNVYVADTSNDTIRMITSAGVVTTLAGLAQHNGSTDGTGSAARFNSPGGVAVDSSGNVYVADTGNHTIRRVTSGGVVTTVAGTSGLNGSLDGTGSAARFKAPNGVAVDSSGTLYVADTQNQTIRKITTGGVVTTIGGTANINGTMGGIGTAARFYLPNSVAVAANGTLFIADSNNDRISQGVPGNAPTVNSPSSTSITSTTATLGGTVSSDGGSAITERGVVYSITSTNGSPQIGGAGVTQVTASGTTGLFTLSASSLTAGTAYSFAAYATNSIGTTYTSVATFTTLTSQQDWRETYFGTTANSGTAADDADSDGDGIPNLVEYALGLNPTVESTLPQTTVINGSNLEYTYTRSDAALNAGTVFTVQWSATLAAGSWSSAGVVQTVQSDNGTTQQVKAVIPLNGAASLFARLSITAPP